MSKFFIREALPPYNFNTPRNILTYNKEFITTPRKKGGRNAALTLYLITDRALRSEYGEAHVPYGCWARQGTQRRSA